MSKEFTKEKLLALADKYGLKHTQIEEIHYFYFPKIGILDDEDENEYRDDLFDWSEGTETILIYNSYLLRIGVSQVWSAQFECSEEVDKFERLEAIVSYMVEMSNSLIELKKKALALNLKTEISKDF